VATNVREAYDGARVRSFFAILLGLVAATGARGETEPVVIRMATMAPGGTAWAREFNAFAREVAQQTNGAVHIKWYFSGIVGDEPSMGQRLARGQIDGLASAGPLCERWAPSMRVLRVVGLLTTPSEATYANDRLRPVFLGEFHKSGVVPLTIVPIGPHILFSRTPIRSLLDLRRAKLWVWDRDDVLRTELDAFRVPTVPLPIEQAAAAFDDGRVDGFIAPASVALAFQWSAHTSYVTDLRLDYFTGCIVLADRAFDPLPAATQAILRQAGAKLGVRFAAVSLQQDAALLGGLFARQGVKHVPVTPGFAAEFFELARATRDRLDERLVPHDLLMRVLAILADFRASR
jgi:TRAP-type transport system periplasmic protein